MSNLSGVMDKRVQKTRQGIYKAFIELLSEKTLDKITIKDIIERANIGRSTFYDHYAVKEELLEQVCIELFEHTFVERQVPVDPSEMTTHLFYHFKQNKDKVKTLLLSHNNYFNQQFSNYLTQYLYPLVITQMRQNFKGFPENLLESFFETSFMNLLIWWLSQEDALSEAELADYFLTIILGKTYDKNSTHNRLGSDGEE